MNYIEFHKQWQPFGCFNIHQIRVWDPHFNRHNLREWERKGLIVKLRKEYYAFSECKRIPDFSRYVAARIYRPSYISLHTALSFYGMIPEAVVQITSVTTLKTSHFINDFGEYTYSSVKPGLMFGYVPKAIGDGRTYFLATPEKALLDLLYLNPYYKTEQDMLDLRFDDDYMNDEFNVDLFMEYADRIASNALDSRIQTLLNAYGI